MAILFYQPKYGFAIVIIEYNFDWDGQKKIILVTQM